ncbi:peptide deformylase [Patescibacteria group bacterium]
MAIKEVTKIGNTILNNKSKNIDNFEVTDLQTLARDLIDTMHAKDGIGIAAPQIGIALRVIIINTDDNPLVMVNPKIVKHSWRKVDGEEGCLSIPGVYGMVSRYRQVQVVGYNLDGTKQLINADGLLARVFQHEVDHINGKLFIKRAKKITRGQEILEKK